MKNVQVKDFWIGEHQPLVVISGPCVIENEQLAMESAQMLHEIFSAHDHVRWIYKSSYDKANRSSLNSYRGPGIEEGLRILERVKKEFDIPILTDVHTPEEAKQAGAICDVLQIPAFLCRQTDLIVAAAATGAVINVKKGQFMAPWDMGNVIKKIVAMGNESILLTERGTSFGYNNLVSDMRSIPILQGYGYPVCYDASHSVQLPGGLGHASSGERQYIPTLTRAAIAAGCNCLFIESHPRPEEAKSDPKTVFPINGLTALLHQILPIYEIIHLCPTNASPT